MTYVLLALVGQDLAPTLAATDRYKVVELADGFELIHLDREVRVPIGDLTLGSYQLSPAMLAGLRARYAGPPARALLEAEFWAGTGYQFACAWSGSDEVLRPTTTSNDPSPDDPPGGPWPNPPAKDWAINQALRAIGVQSPPDTDRDEFRQLGLDEERVRSAWQRADLETLAW